MTQLTYPVPVPGSPFSTEAPKVDTALTQIQNVVNGNLDSSNLNAGGVLLGSCLYAPGTNTQLPVPTTFGALSAANLTVSFTAPTSGKVTVRLQGWYLVTAFASTGYVNVGVTGHGGSTQFGNSYQAVNTAQTGAVPFAGMVTTDIEVAGLTAGQSYQFDWAAGTPPASATAAVWAAAATGISTGGGPATMKVYSA